MALINRRLPHQVVPDYRKGAEFDELTAHGAVSHPHNLEYTFTNLPASIFDWTVAGRQYTVNRYAMRLFWAAWCSTIMVGHDLRCQPGHAEAGGPCPGGL